MDVETGRYVNEGYSCVSDNVRGGILDLMPLDGAQFIHEFWGEVKKCRPCDLTSQVWKNSGWALHCIQMDLRHHIGRVSGTTTLDGRDSVVLPDVIKCDEGGWVLIDDLVRKDILWSSSSRRITQSVANLRDRDQRLCLYNERVQLLINGNLLSARKPGGKVRLQFLGIRVKEPPGCFLHPYGGPRQATRENHRQWQHHCEPPRAFQPREGGLVLRTERQRSERLRSH